jgi:hypothetical protein
MASIVTVVEEAPEDTVTAISWVFSIFGSPMRDSCAKFIVTILYPRDMLEDGIEY